MFCKGFLFFIGIVLLFKESLGAEENSSPQNAEATPSQITEQKESVFHSNGAANIGEGEEDEEDPSLEEPSQEEDSFDAETPPEEDTEEDEDVDQNTEITND